MVTATRFGRYELLEKIGEGGMAALWRARVKGPGGFARTIAVKRILPHLATDPAFIAMFLSEARLSAQLAHANVVQVFECGEVDGEYFLAMEYIDGINLARAVQLHASAKRMLDPAVAAYVAREACRALAHVHALVDEEGRALGLVHRDVTPSNVMLGRDGAIKLLDFGIAKALDVASDVHTRTGVFKGKVGYASPELAEGESIDHRSDQFSVGVLLHEALTARRLFKGGSDLQTLALVRKAEVAKPSLRNPSVPPALDEVCMRALSLRPDDRFASCTEMADALDGVISALGAGPRVVVSMLKEIAPAGDSPVQAGSAPTPLPHAPTKILAPARARARAFAFAALVGLGGIATLAIYARRSSETPRASDVPTGAASGSAAPQPTPPLPTRPMPPQTVAPIPTPAPPSATSTPEVAEKRERPDRKPTAVRSKPSRPSSTSGGKVGGATGQTGSAGSGAAPPDLKGGAIVDPFAGGARR